MRGTFLIGCGVLAAAAALGGCKSNSGQLNSLAQENEGLRSQLADRNQAIESTQAELRERDERIARLQQELADADRLSADMSYVAAAEAVDPFSGIEGVTGSVAAGEVTATVESDVLFDAGKSTLKSSARQSLDAVAGVLRSSYAGRAIRVSGHTDTDPIRKSGFKSNYHLGFERAYAVREYLVKKGVDPSQVYVASHGPDQAKQTKQASRRVEIAVVLEES